MVPETSQKRPVVLAVSLIVFGVIGWIAAFALTVEKFELLKNPGTVLSCDYGFLVQCSKNLESAQGSLLCFPNPILGLTGWTAVIVVGAALLSGARFANWFWVLFNIGTALAFALIVFLIVTSIYFLGTLCPWCMVTWIVTIPTFLAVTLRNLSTIPRTGALKRFAQGAYGWVAGASIILYIVIAALAQLQLNVLARL